MVEIEEFRVENICVRCLANLFNRGMLILRRSVGSYYLHCEHIKEEEGS